LIFTKKDLIFNVLANSKTSWEGTTNNAVMEASKTIKDISSVYAQEMSTTVKDGKVAECHVGSKGEVEGNTYELLKHFNGHCS
jgi:dodecin